MLVTWSLDLWARRGYLHAYNGTGRSQCCRHCVQGGWIAAILLYLDFVAFQVLYLPCRLASNAPWLHLSPVSSPLEKK